MDNTTSFAITQIPKGLILRDRIMDEDGSDVYDRITADIDSQYYLYEQKNADARRNSQFIKNEQWSEEDKVAFIRQNRIPYVFNQISPKIDALIGAHAALRIDVKAVPVEEDDGTAATITNRFIKWGEQINRMSDIEDQVFYDMIVKGRGITQVRWEMSDGYSGSPIVERIPIYQVMWDGGAVDKELVDATWMCRVIPMNKRSAIEEMPEYADIIEQEAGSGDAVYMADWELMTLRQYGTLSGLRTSDSLLNYVRVIEHYERFKRYVFLVMDELSGVTLEYDTLEEAEQDVKDRLDVYQEYAFPLYNPDGTDRVYVASLMKDAIVQTIIIGQRVVSREMTTLPTFPYQVAFCNFDDGDFWSYVDALIHPQIFLNRQISNWDDQTSRANKNLITVIPNRLHRSYTIEAFNRERSKTSPTIPVLSHDAIDIKPNQPAQTDIPQQIGLTMNHMTEVVGGRNALGLQENAAESGNAVRLRQEAAGLSRLPIFSNLNGWRRQVTELMVWFMKNYLSEGQQLRILGKNNRNVEWVNVDLETLDTIRNARTDIVITEAVDTDTMRERQFIQMKELFMTLGGSVPGEVILATMLEYSNIPEESKERIKGMIASLQDYYAKEAKLKEEQEMEASVNKSIRKSQMKDEKEAQLQIAQALASANPSVGATA